MLQPTCFATSWEDLKTVDGVEYDTFADAAAATGILDDDVAALRTLREAYATMITPLNLRVMYVLVCSCFMPHLPTM